MATRHEHGPLDRHAPDGVSDPAGTEQGRARDAREVERNHQGNQSASNHIVNAEGLSETTLSRLRESYQRIAENAHPHGEPPLASERPAAP
jgi:hypothetical protein